MTPTAQAAGSNVASAFPVIGAPHISFVVKAPRTPKDGLRMSVRAKNHGSVFMISCHAAHEGGYGAGVVMSNIHPRALDVAHARFVKQRKWRILPGAFGQKPGAKVVLPLGHFTSLLWPSACVRSSGRDNALAGVARFVIRAAFSGWRPATIAGQLATE